MSQPNKVDFFNCANIFLVVVLVRFPVLCLFNFFEIAFSSIFFFFEAVQYLPFMKPVPRNDPKRERNTRRERGAVIDDPATWDEKLETNN
jgi:hypothetical protein